MINLTKTEFMKIYNEGKNLTDKPIFIDFYADWWGPCKMFEQVLNKVMSDYENKINMYKVDTEKELEMAVLFGVRSLPYMVFISKDGIITPNVGAINKDTLKYFLEGLISKK